MSWRGLDMVCSDARYGGQAGSPPRPRACDRSWPPPTHRRRSRSRHTERSPSAPQTTWGPHAAGARHTTPLARVCLPYRVMLHVAQPGEWRSPTAQDNPRAHEPLPAGRTPFRVRLAPLRTRRLPIARDRDDHGQLPHLRPAVHQRLRVGVMVQPLEAHDPALGAGTCRSHRWRTSVLDNVMHDRGGPQTGGGERKLYGSC
jgi:hypothetical protein